MHICLFDIDGTLLNTGGAGQAAMETVLKAEFGITAPTEGIPTAGRTDRAITRDLIRYHGLAENEEIWTQFLKAYLSELPKELARRTGLVLPGVAALLDHLSNRGDMVLGLLTGNYREGAYLKLKHFALDHHFPFGGFGDLHFERDDVAREALAEARRHRNGDVDLNRVWVIGDTPADVRCGRAIGARVIAVGTGIYSNDDLAAAGPDHFFPDLSDAEPVLALFQAIL